MPRGVWCGVVAPGWPLVLFCVAAVLVRQATAVDVDPLMSVKENFQEVMSGALGVRTPAAVESWNPTSKAFSWRPMSVQYALDYEVVHADSGLLLEYEKLLATASSVSADDQRDTGAVTVDVEARELDTFLSTVQRSLKCDGPSILILNPDRARVSSHMQSSKVVPPDMPATTDLLYRFTYAGGAFTQAWVGRGRFLAVDLTAGPVSTGATTSGEGSVLPGSIPRVAQDVAQHDSSYLKKVFTARLVSVVAEGVRAVIAPDIAVHAELVTPFTERLVIPVVALRDHDEFSPFHKGAGLVDLAAIKEQLARAVSVQHVTLVPGSHHLADHPHLAQAVQQARSTQTVFVRQASSKLMPAHRNSLDPDLLASGLRDSGDALAGGLIAHRHGSTVNAFLGMVTHRWAKQATNQNLAHVAEALALNQENGTILDALRRVDGSHVVPVYLLSLMHPPQSVELERASNLRELQVEEEEVQQSGEVTPRLFNHRSLMTVQDDLVAVLQVPSSNVQLPWTTDGQPVTRDGMRPESQVLAGVLQVVAGLLPPHRHYSDIHDRIVTNYLWANGAHPFEPFGSSIHLSDTMVEVARRNEVLIRVDAAARHVRQAVSEVEAFYDQYLRDPFLGKSNAEESVWIDRLFHESTMLSPFSDTTIQRFHDELEQLSARLQALGAEVSTAPERSMDEAAQVAVAAASYHMFVREQLKAASDAMACCATSHHIPSFGAPRLLGFIWIVSVMLLAWIITNELVRSKRRRRVVDW